MNLYQQLVNKAVASRCEDCKGSGTLDDASDYDIYYNTWTCPCCKGTVIEQNEHQS